MSYIKTATGENTITFDAFYQYIWARNYGDVDVYISNHNNIVAGDDDVALLPAGEAVRLTVNGKTLYVLGSTTLEVHAQNFSDSPFAWNEAGEGGGSDVSVVSLSVNENGTYTAPTGTAYSPVTVSVSPNVGTKTIIDNGTYTASSDNLDGYSSVTVNVQNEPLSKSVFYAQDNLGDSAANTYTVLESGRYLAINAVINNEASTFTLTSTVTSTGTVVDYDDINTSYASDNRNVSINFSIIDCDINDTISFSSSKSGGSYVCYCHAVLKIDDSINSLTLEECIIKSDGILTNPYTYTFADSTKKHLCVALSSRRDNSNLMNFVCDSNGNGSGQQANHLAMSCTIIDNDILNSKSATESATGYASHGFICYELG